MTRGVYTAAAGMLASEAAQDAIAQNLANAGTVGYKEDIPRFESFQEALASQSQGDRGAVGGLGSGVSLKDETTNFADGSLQKSGNPLDVALVGDAALAVQTPRGIRLSRDGALSLDVRGDLVQTNGNALVLGDDNRPIAIPAKAKEIVISPKGDVTADGVRVGRLRLAGLSQSDRPVKMGDNQYSVAALRPAGPNAAVRQGYLEASNVSVVKEMVSMISIMRAYETNQKMLQAEDDTTGKATTEVSKI